MLHRYPVFIAMPSGKKGTPYNAFIDTLQSIKCYLHKDTEVLEVTLPKMIYIGNDRDGETSGLLSPGQVLCLLGHSSRQDHVGKTS